MVHHIASATTADTNPLTRTRYYIPLPTTAATCHRVVQVPKYLVKWRNLSYRDCTWETSESVSDDAVIAKYHAANTPPPDEAPLWRDEIWKELNPLAHAKVVSTSYYTSSLRCLVFDSCEQC